jgi:beta-xylosidase
MTTMRQSSSLKATLGVKVNNRLATHVTYVRSSGGGLISKLRNDANIEDSLQYWQDIR